MRSNQLIEEAREVLESWGVDESSIARILRWDDSWEERCVLVLSMRDSIARVFSNPANIKGFMGMRNNNSGFLGKTPIEIINTGCLDDLRQVAKNLKHISVR